MLVDLWESSYNLTHSTIKLNQVITWNSDIALGFWFWFPVGFAQNTLKYPQGFLIFVASRPQAN